MNILIAGYGVKIAEFVDMLSTSIKKIYIISDHDFKSFKFQKDIIPIKVSPFDFSPEHHKVELNIDEDIIIITDYEEDRLARTLTNFCSYYPQERIITISHHEELSKQFPNVVFKSYYSTFRNEFKQLFKKVQIQSKLVRLQKLVQNYEKVAIIIWGNPDPDSLASAYGLKYLLKEHTKTVEIVYTGEFTRHENLAMVQLLKIPVSKFNKKSLNNNTFTITVDAQPDFFDEALGLKFNACIDHHPKKTEFYGEYEDIRSRYGSASTMISEYFYYSDIGIPENCATALFYGIKTDTDNLTKNTFDADITSYQILRRHTDFNKLDLIRLSQMPFDTLTTMNRAITNLIRHKDMIFSYLGKIENPHYCVYIAENFIRITEISIFIIAGITEDKLLCIMRSDGIRKNVGELATRLFSAYGKAGGHKTMARVEIPLKNLRSEGIGPEQIEGWLNDLLIKQTKQRKNNKPHDSETWQKPSAKPAK